VTSSGNAIFTPSGAVFIALMLLALAVLRRNPAEALIKEMI
jgi:hypothetical protein